MKRLSFVFLSILLMAGCSGSDSSSTSDPSDTVDTPPGSGYSTTRVTMGTQCGAEPATLDDNGKRKVDALNYYFNGNAEIINGFPRQATAVLNWSCNATPLDTSMGVIPMSVFYSTKAGSEDSFEKFQEDVNTENLPKHYIDLGLLASYFSFAINQEKTEAGSILINPDLLGEVLKKGWLTKELPIDVNAALTAAVCVLSSQNFEGSKSLDELWQAYGTSWQAWGKDATDFDEAFTPVVTDCLANPQTSVEIPEFENSFKGYTLGLNWLVEKYGNEKLTYGWLMNISTPTEIGWLYNNLSEDQIQATFTNPVVETLQNTAYSDASYMPDFLAFDKYGADDTYPVQQLHAYPYFFNARDWDNYLTAVKQTSEDLDDMPIMLWQIPGGHIQYDGDSYTNPDHISSFSTYLFGDENLNEDLSNTINLDNVKLDAYHNCGEECGAVSYLKMNNYNWQTSDRMDDVINANIFAIHWQSYTYPTVGIYDIITEVTDCNDKGWLADKVKAYAGLTK